MCPILQFLCRIDLISLKRKTDKGSLIGFGLKNVASFSENKSLNFILLPVLLLNQLLPMLRFIVSVKLKIQQY